MNNDIAMFEINVYFFFKNKNIIAWLRAAPGVLFSSTENNYYYVKDYTYELKVLRYK